MFKKLFKHALYITFCGIVIVLVSVVVNIIFSSAGWLLVRILGEQAPFRSIFLVFSIPSIILVCLMLYDKYLLMKKVEKEIKMKIKAERKI